MEIYHDLTPWYRLLDPPGDHAAEAALYRAAFDRVVAPPAESLLELGSGAGHNALFLKEAYTCTLADPSEPMLGLSRELNPACEHVRGDMRTVRLGRTFDAVLIHDAIVYMHTTEDLRAAAETAYVHLRPGGAAIFAPDCVRETFRESSDDHEGVDGERAMKCLAWMWDPDPSDTQYTVDYAFLLRSGNEVRAVHDRHIEGLFDEATWQRVLSEVGFAVEPLDRPLDPEEKDGGYTDRVFLGLRPE